MCKAIWTANGTESAGLTLPAGEAGLARVAGPLGVAGQVEFTHCCLLGGC